MALQFSGQRLRAARNAANLSQAKLAERIGRTSPSICFYERGSVTPPVNVLLQLADVLECDLADFLDKEAAPNVAA